MKALHKLAIACVALGLGLSFLGSIGDELLSFNDCAMSFMTTSDYVEELKDPGTGYQLASYTIPSPQRARGRVHAPHAPAAAPDTDVEALLVYIPGSGGSYDQVRSLSSSLMRVLPTMAPRELEAPVQTTNVRTYTFNFGGELSAFNGHIAGRQTDFVKEGLTFLRDKYKDRPSLSIILVGHSMGGVIGLTAWAELQHTAPSGASLLLALAAPFAKHPWASAGPSLAARMHAALALLPASALLPVVSVASAKGDLQVPAALARPPPSVPSEFLEPHRTAGMWSTCADHWSVNWCIQTAEPLARGVASVLHDGKLRAIHAQAEGAAVVSSALPSETLAVFRKGVRNDFVPRPFTDVDAEGNVIPPPASNWGALSLDAPMIRPEAPPTDTKSFIVTPVELKQAGSAIKFAMSFKSTARPRTITLVASNLPEGAENDLQTTCERGEVNPDLVLRVRSAPLPPTIPYQGRTQKFLLQMYNATVHKKRVSGGAVGSSRLWTVDDIGPRGNDTAPWNVRCEFSFTFREKAGPLADPGHPRGDGFNYPRNVAPPGIIAHAHSLPTSEFGNASALRPIALPAWIRGGPFRIVTAGPGSLPDECMLPVVLANTKAGLMAVRGGPFFSLPQYALSVASAVLERRQGLSLSSLFPAVSQASETFLRRTATMPRFTSVALWSAGPIDEGGLLLLQDPRAVCRASQEARLTLDVGGWSLAQAKAMPAYAALFGAGVVAPFVAAIVIALRSRKRAASSVQLIGGSGDLFILSGALLLEPSLPLLIVGGRAVARPGAGAVERLQGLSILFAGLLKVPLLLPVVDEVRRVLGAAGVALASHEGGRAVVRTLVQLHQAEATALGVQGTGRARSLAALVLVRLANVALDRLTS